MLFINSAYTQDAGCPIFPMEFVNDIQNLAIDLEFTFLDFNLDLYNQMDGYNNYGYLKSISGGYAISNDKARRSIISDYRFEALPTLKLLICLLNTKNFKENFLIKAIHEVCQEYGMEYNTVYHLLLSTSKVIDSFVMNIDDENIVMNMPSVPSVFIGVWLAAKIKEKNPNFKITATGNQINIPEVASYVKKAGYIDDFINTKVHNNPLLKLRDVLEKLKAKSFDYPLYYGLKIIPYELSHGCPAKCNFCTERLAWNSLGEIKDRYEFKDTEECITEIQYLMDEYKISGLTFNDCMLNLNLPRYKKLIQFLSESNLLLSGSIRIDMLDNDMLDLFEKLKFTNVIIGLETLNKNAVNTYNKGNKNYTQNAWNIIPKLIEKNITPQINFIISHPYEGDEDVIKSVRDIEEFANYIDSIDIPLTDISAGEILINYPSETYFKVLKDDNFKVVYHDVPLELQQYIKADVQEAINKIPYKASKTSIYWHINKNQLLKKIQGIQCKDAIKSIESNFSVLYKHKEKLLQEWEKFNVKIRVIGKIKNISGDSNYRVINAITKNSDRISVNTLLDSWDEGDEVVREVLILSLLGIIDLEGGYYA